MPRINLLLLFLFLSFKVFTQNETQNWFFGNQCGLNFASNPPSSVLSPVFNATEGGSSISDAAGNLLFYSDGVTVWNSIHLVMANGNGLFGNQSSTQSSVIIKQPGSAFLYYLFTQEEKGYANGFRYSVIDMSLAAGMGSVTVKNIPIYTPSCEKLSAVKHCNGSDVWILTHDYNSNVFRAVLLTSAGLNSTPVLSAVGPVLSDMNYNSVLKISPSGKKIAMPSLMGNNLRLFDFNTATGVVSNHVILSNIVSYGCEFSPDGTKLYAGVDNVYQWDLCAGNVTAVQNSSVTLWLNSQVGLGSYQLGLNGKIYIAQLQSNMLAVVDNPNLAGSASNFVPNGQPLTTGNVTMGLPNFLVSSLKTLPSFSFTQNCNLATFTLPPLPEGACDAGQTFTASSWIFSDPSSGAANTSTLSVASHSFSSPGTYKVKLLLYHECGADTVSQDVTIGPFPLLTINSPTSICAGSSATLTVSGANSYTWNTGATTTSLLVSPLLTTSYSVTGSSVNGCSSSAGSTLAILSSGTPTLDFSYKSPVCISDINPLPQLSAGFSSGGLFSSPDLTVNSGTGLIDLVSGGVGTFIITYSIAEQNCIASGSKTTSIIILEAPLLTVSPDTRIAPGKTAVLEVKGGYTYSWSPATDMSCSNCSDPEVSPKVTTIYCVTSASSGCVSKRCIYVEVTCDTGGDLSLPNAFTPNGDGNNDLFCIQGWDLCTTHFSVLIFNRWGEKVFESSNSSFCWDGTFKGKVLNPDVFIYSVSASFSDGRQVSKKGNINLLH
ncbi:hypothetical protein CNR22_11855 [Sphingobacteriaceae bacterium]|nr:hypothetical protein CNR22_11855 [Sphingobacteriaceae bacterium]